MKFFSDTGFQNAIGRERIIAGFSRKQRERSGEKPSQSLLLGTIRQLKMNTQMMLPRLLTKRTMNRLLVSVVFLPKLGGRLIGTEAIPRILRETESRKFGKSA